MGCADSSKLDDNELKIKTDHDHLDEDSKNKLHLHEVSLLEKSTRLIRYLHVKYGLVGSFVFGLNGKMAEITVEQAQIMSIEERIKINLKSRGQDSIIEDNIYYEILVYMFYTNLKNVFNCARELEDEDYDIKLSSKQDKLYGVVIPYVHYEVGHKLHLEMRIMKSQVLKYKENYDKYLNDIWEELKDPTDKVL